MMPRAPFGNAERMVNRPLKRTDACVSYRMARSATPWTSMGTHP